MERGDDDSLWCNAPKDILGLISSRLVAGEYVVFRAVCRNWRDLVPLPRIPREYNTPRLMTLYEERGDVEFFHPLHDALITQKMDIPELVKGSRIRCALKDWLLMSKGNRGMFFFNAVSKVIINLPDLLEAVENFFPEWTFSCPPDSSSDCFVVGFLISGTPPPVYMIKVGESRWTFHNFLNNNKPFVCSNSIFFGNDTIYVLGQTGTLGILNINGKSATQRPTWKFYGQPWPSQKLHSIEQVYTAKEANNRTMLVVFLMEDEGKVEIWRYKITGKVLKREKITNLHNNTLFVSEKVSYLKSCIAQGLGNKIYFPMFDVNNNGIFYCLTTHKYFSLDYSRSEAFSSSNYYNLVQPQSSIWID